MNDATLGIVAALAAVCSFLGFALFRSRKRARVIDLAEEALRDAEELAISRDALERGEPGAHLKMIEASNRLERKKKELVKLRASSRVKTDSEIKELLRELGL